MFEHIAVLNVFLKYYRVNCVAVSLLCSLCGAMQRSCYTLEIVTLSCDPPPRMLRLDIMGYRAKLIGEVELCHA